VDEPGLYNVALPYVKSRAGSVRADGQGGRAVNFRRGADEVVSDEIVEEGEDIPPSPLSLDEYGYRFVNFRLGAMADPGPPPLNWSGSHEENAALAQIAEQQARSNAHMICENCKKVIGSRL
jgi:hypothetical protein